MENSTQKVIAVLKNPNKDGVGKVNILIDLYTASKRNRIFFPTSYKVHKYKFYKGRVVGNNKEAQLLNSSINEEIHLITQQIRDLRKEGKPITKETLQQLRSSQTAFNTDLGTYLIEFKAHYAGKVETQKKIQTFINHFDSFANGKKYYLQSINQKWIKDFETHMLNNMQHPNSVFRSFKIWKIFMNYLYQYHHQEIPKNLKYPSEVETTRVTLDKSDIENVFKFIPPNERLAKVRLLSLIGFYTGLRQSDLNRITKKHLVNGCIQISMQKVHKTVTIPIAPQLKIILESINYDVKGIGLSNQKFNKYLKELYQLAGVTQPVEIIAYNKGLKYYKTVPKCEVITTHSHRRGWICTAIESGMSLSTIMLVSGHRKLSTLQTYIQVDQFLGEDFKKFSNHMAKNG